MPDFASNDELLTRKDERGVVTLVLNRASKRNALSENLLMNLVDAFDKIEKSKDARAVVLRGSGGSFCSGLDLKDALTGGSRDASSLSARGLNGSTLAYFLELGEIPSGLFMSALLQSVLCRMITLDCPVIGWAEGDARGGGAGLLCACDYVVATRDFRAGFTEVRRGFSPAFLYPFLERKLSAGALKSVLLTGQVFSSRRAYELGLAHCVTDAEGAASEIESLITTLLQNSARSMSQVKAKTLSSLLPREDELFAALLEHWDSMRSPEGREGARAFLEKRRPRFDVGDAD